MIKIGKFICSDINEKKELRLKFIILKKYTYFLCFFWMVFMFFPNDFHVYSYKKSLFTFPADMQCFCPADWFTGVSTCKIKDNVCLQGDGWALYVIFFLCAEKKINLILVRKNILTVPGNFPLISLSFIVQKIHIKSKISNWGFFLTYFLAVVLCYVSVILISSSFKSRSCKVHLNTNFWSNVALCIQLPYHGSCFMNEDKTKDKFSFCNYSDLLLSRFSHSSFSFHWLEL